MSRDLGLHLDSYDFKLKNGGRTPQNEKSIRDHISEIQSIGNSNRSRHGARKQSIDQLVSEFANTVRETKSRSKSAYMRKTSLTTNTVEDLTKFTPMETVKATLSKRRAEVINLIQLYLRKAGAEPKFDKDAVLPVDDFKQCL
jgi:hypothetical protein